MTIGIIITNPNHHVNLTIEAAVLVKSKGHTIEYISLCELRRMVTPVDLFKEKNIDVHKITQLPKKLKPSSGKKSLGSSTSIKRKLVQNALWLIFLKKSILSHLKKYDRIVLMNDTAFPYNKISSALKRIKIPFFLLQEGIRFPLPAESESKYGGSGADKIMVWGEASKTHFKSVAMQHSKIVVTGNPNFDKFADYFAKQSRIDKPKTLGIFTNTIDDQGFCTYDEKLNLFKQFLIRSKSYIQEEKIQVGIKTHPRENLEAYEKILRMYIDDYIVLSEDIKEAISQVDAGIIMASTVGLELLAANRRIGQMEIPEYGYVFDYVNYNENTKIPLQGNVDISPLFGQVTDNSMLKEHIKIGGSVERIASQLLGN